MSDSQGILLFTTSASAGSASSDYDKDAFQDISLPADSNSGLTSTLSTNPLNGKYLNDGSTKWMAKTLWIKDLQRVEDRTLWVNGKATYRIIWNESFPGVDGFVFGGCQLSGTSESRYVSVPDIGDGCGVTGLLQRVQWIIRPKAGTATASQTIDGAAATAINFGGYTGLGLNFQTTKPVWNPYVSDSANAASGLHTFMVTADQSNLMEVVGCVVYSNITGDGVAVQAGDTFVDKVKVSGAGATFAYPLGVSNFLGGVDGIYISSNGAYGVTTSPIPGVAANCSGASGANLLSVSIGSGASFPVGTGVFIPDGGASYYLGSVTQVSGDVLTLSPTFTFGLSNICSALFNAGPSFAISASLMQESFSYDPAAQYRMPIGISGLSVESPFSYSDPYLRYRAWGSTLRLVNGNSLSTGIGSTIGVMLPAATDFIQFEGRFSALEFEFIAGQSALLSATLSIDGMYATGYTVPINGPTVFRRSVFANGSDGYHSVRLAETGSTNILLSRVIGYKPVAYGGPSFGLLSQIPKGITFLPRNAQNASLMAFGNVTRVFAESFRANGASWGSSAMLTGPGGRYISTVNDGDYMEFQYFGTQFSLMGTPGTSILFTVDGSSLGVSMNAWNGAGLTLGFHTVRTIHKAGTSLSIFAADFLSPVRQVKNMQMFSPLKYIELTPRTWSQSDEPLNSRAGDVWEQNVAKKLAYQKLFGGWQLMSYATQAAFYSRGSTQVIANNTESIVDFNIKELDTYDSVTTGTGWKFVAQTKGIARVATFVGFISSADWEVGETYILRLWKNSSIYKTLVFEQVQASVAQFLMKGGKAEVPVEVGDSLWVTVEQNSDNALSLRSVPEDVWISIVVSPTNKG